MEDKLNLDLEPLNINEATVTDCLKFLSDLKKVTKSNKSLDNCIQIFTQLDNALRQYKSDRDYSNFDFSKFYANKL